MPDAPRDLPPTPPAAVPVVPAAPKKSGRSVLFVIVPLLLLAAGGGYYVWEKAQEVPPVDEFNYLRPFFAQLVDEQKLAAAYADGNSDLVADPPADPGKFATVTEIGFSVVGTADEAKLADEQAEWKDFMAALAKATDKKVVYQADVGGPDAQMEALRAHKLHVTAFNTGAVPEAVNTAGFVPLVAPADAAGVSSYVMEIVVPAGSPVTKPEELRGKTVGFVSLSSNSGARAPMYLLKDKFGLLPGRDYSYKLTGDHVASLGEVVYGNNEFAAVCVASDLKGRAAAAGKVRFRGQTKDFQADQVRTIYASAPFPPLCFGVAHDLPPALRQSIDKAFADFRFAGTSVAGYAKQGKTQFARVDYKKDWQFVRDIDHALAGFAKLP